MLRIPNALTSAELSVSFAGLGSEPVRGGKAHLAHAQLAKGVLDELRAFDHGGTPSLDTLAAAGDALASLVDPASTRGGFGRAAGGLEAQAKTACAEVAALNEQPSRNDPEKLVTVVDPQRIAYVRALLGCDGVREAARESK